MIGRINVCGGGGLNFKIIGDTSVPANPQENMVWVNTDKKITSWMFCSTEPTDAIEGVVWFATGANSEVSFNALKKNAIEVFLIGAKQYVNGSWANVEAHIYQSGSWKQFSNTILYIYYNGTEYYTITSKGAKEDSSHGTAAAPTITRNSDSISFSLSKNTSSRRCGIAYPDTKFDLTGATNIKVDYNCDIVNVDGIGQVYFVVYTELGTYLGQNDVIKQKISNGSGTLNVDVSELSGEHYLAFWLYTYTSGGAGAVKITITSWGIE